MSANPSRLGEFSFAVEGAFAEVATSVDTKMQLVSRIDTSGLEQQKEDIQPTVAYQNDGAQDIPLPRRGTFTTEFILAGHGSTCAGAITLNELEELLGYVIGNADASTIGGTADGTGSVSAPGVGSMNAPAGSLVRFGVLNDGRGGGQAAAVESMGAGVLNLLTAIAGVPNDGDVVYAMALAYPNEAPTALSVTSLRCLLATTNQRYLTFGSVATGIEFVLPQGGVPRVRINWACAFFEEEAASTFPSGLATATFTGAPIAAGSFFLQEKGTTTRQTYEVREFNLNIELGVELLEGPGAPRALQTIIGARRHQCRATFDFVVDADAASASPLWPTRWDSSTWWSVLYTLTAEDQRALALWLPRCKMVGPRPSQFDMQNLNRQRVQMAALTNDDDTSALTRASLVLGMG